MICEGKEVNKDMEMVDLALRYLKTDKLSVFPVGKDKKPLVNWKEYQTKFPTMKQVRDWWKQYPEAQIGIATGKLSNITVVDVEAGGDWSYLPETLTVKTGGNGRHFIYAYYEGIKNKARIRELTDFRGEGGYIVAAGSTSEKGTYEIVKLMKPTPFPIHLFPDALKSETSPFMTKAFNQPVAPVPVVEKKEYVPVPGKPINIFEAVQLESLEDELVKSYPGYAPGQRNQAMAQFTGIVLKRLHPSEWDTRGWAIISDANDKNSPALSDFELGAIFRSIKARETIQLTQGIGTSQNPPVQHVLPAQQTQSVCGEDEIKHISVVANEQKLNQTDIYPLQMPCFDEAILGGVCPGDLVIIAGKTGEGKSSLGMDWTLSMIRGEKKAPVLWFSYELLPTHLWAKFQKMGMTEKDVAVIPAKHSSGNVAWVETKVKEAKERFGVKVVVIDHLGFLLPKIQNVFGKNMSSNYATYLTQITREIKTIAIQEEVIIILPVHMRKTEKVDMDAIKDSVGISQESDLVFLIERERDKKKAAKSYYTDYTKITLSKNRKTGITVVGWFKMLNERFAYDIEKNNTEDQNNKDKDEAEERFENIDKKEIGPVASSPVNKFGYQPRPYEDATDKAIDKFPAVTVNVAEITPETKIYPGTVIPTIESEESEEDKILKSMFQ